MFISYLAGAVPFSGLAARLLAGVDLRSQGSGTVSGTGLYEVTGFRPLAVAGSLDVAMGAVGPLLAGRRRPILGGLSAGAAVTGHNWSPFLGGAGGRGLSTALGATLAAAPEGTLVLGACMGLGRLVRQTGLASLLGIVALIPVLGRRRGLAGVVLGASLALPMVMKRVLGNGRPEDRSDLGRVFLWRLLFDQDPDKT